MITRSVFLMALAAALALAQEPSTFTMAVPHEAAVAYPAQEEFNVKVPPPGADVLFLRTEVAGSGEVVKGAPYSAETITEFTQTLADGNVIRHKQTGNIYRDSEGRTRREQSLGRIGNLPMPQKAVQLTFINDPVAGVSYVLDANRKTAEKLPMMKGAFEAGIAAGGPGHMGFAGGGGTRIMHSTRAVRALPATTQGEAQSESETRVIEGVQTVGNRTTHTIPAGEIGNERPIETVSERWYSPELQTVVMSKQVDPRMGETTYRLANVNRDEPARSLFEVPADYTVTEGPQKMMLHERHEIKQNK
jgi:hypothetical protein